MEVERILKFSEEEFNILTEAGKLLRKLSDERDTYDILAEDVKNILEALQKVLTYVTAKSSSNQLRG